MKEGLSEPFEAPSLCLCADVCSDHFTELCFVSLVLEGFRPSRQMLKPDAVPTIFSFSSLPKRRKLSEAKQAKAQHRSVVEELLKEQNSDVATETARVVTTQDVGTQCGKLTKKYMITVIYIQIYPLKKMYVHRLICSWWYHCLNNCHQCQHLKLP